MLPANITQLNNIPPTQEAYYDPNLVSGMVLYLKQKVYPYQVLVRLFFIALQKLEAGCMFIGVWWKVVAQII